MEETARKIKENASCWYAVYTAPRAEKKVKEQLDKIGIDNYLPLQPVIRMWNNRKKKIFIPVVPGCLFVYISSEEIAQVTSIHGVTFLLKEKGRYVSIPEVQMETFRTMIERSHELVEFAPTDFVPGATVQVKGSTKGAISDIDGLFTISSEPGSILIFSFLGYQSIEYKIDKVPQTIKLLPKVDELDEVTVVGFAKQKKESVIGAISTLKPERLKIPTSNLTQALGGNVAGIISYQLSGEPGNDNVEFFIRGVTTFGYSKSPLILIDNIESSTTDLSRLSADDIAAFSIMKDATATAIYGARGANGVILITTKQGKPGKVKISARVEGSLSAPTKRIDMVDPISYMKYHNEAVLTRNPLAVRPHTDEKIASTKAGKNPYVYPAVDWYNELFNDNVFNSRANINMSGGSETARYYVSLGISDDNLSLIHI